MLEYFLPTMLTMAALSLDEFADSMIVSNLLGNGGAMLYALSLSKRDTETAGKAFRLSIFTALITGLLFVLAGFVFFNPIAQLLCSDASLMPAFRPYLRGLLLTAPFIITILTPVGFLPPSGAPKIATAINLIANTFNLLVTDEADIAENIRLLSGISSRLEYAYTMGMNRTRITIARKEAEPS